MKFPCFILPRLRATIPLALAVICLGSGCSTIASRTKEKSAVYNRLDPQTQAMIRQGHVEIGYTPDMVYMALGHPDDHVTAQNQQVTWIYTTTYQEYEGTAHAGYRRAFASNPETGAVYVFLDPVYTDSHQDQAEENIRLIFQNGLVASIDRAKP